MPLSYKKEIEIPKIDSGICIYSPDSWQIWIAPTKECFYQNFIYKEDLDSKEFKNNDELRNIINNILPNIEFGRIKSKVCYILDNPILEKYTPYYYSTYPQEVFGQPTPKGCFIKRFDDRFRRDSVILKLEEEYNNVSVDGIANVLEKDLKPNEAIIISDGSNVLEVSTCSFWYIDDSTISTHTETIIPEDPDQATLIAEVRGALNALKKCKENLKKEIVYYYDNTSIINCFNNSKTEYIKEVKEFKELIIGMDKEGYVINFIEVHPKQTLTDEEYRKGLNFFHNYCDRMCSEVSHIFLKGYLRSININKENAVKAKELREKQEKKKQNTKRNSNNSYKDKIDKFNQIKIRK